jgi:hypothetical protein
MGGPPINWVPLGVQNWISFEDKFLTLCSGKRHLGKRHSGKLHVWGNVTRGNITQGNDVWGNDVRGIAVEP